MYSCVFFGVNSSIYSFFFSFFCSDYVTPVTLFIIRSELSQVTQARNMTIDTVAYVQNIIQISPEGEVNSGEYTVTRSVEVYI